MARRVFVSYSSKEAARVRVLAEDIGSLGHQVWFDHELTGGQRWWDQILAELRDCDTFVFAVSGEAVDSRACLGELTYAQALGKPVLPVVIERNFADSLLPPALAELQRVDYTIDDKRAFASLNRALSRLPVAPPLPEPLPDPPPVPASYLFDLKSAIDEPGAMSVETQDQVLSELHQRLKDGYPPADVLALTGRFRRRDDVLVRIDRELAALEQSLADAPAPAPAAAEPSAAPAPVATQAAAAASPPASPVAQDGPPPVPASAAPSPAAAPEPDRTPDPAAAPRAAAGAPSAAVTFPQAVQSGFQHYVNFRDRSGRGEYWYWFLFSILAFVGALMLDLVLFTEFFVFIAWLALIVPSVAVGVRRLHDTGRSGWHLLWNLVPLVGAVYLIYLYLQPSDGPNQYGAAPLLGAPGTPPPPDASP